MPYKSLDARADCWLWDEVISDKTDAGRVPAAPTLDIKSPAVLPQITKGEARKAAKDLGLDVVSIDNLESQAVLGRFIEQSGAIRITTGEFVVSNSVRDRLIQLCLKSLKARTPVKRVMEIGAFINKLLESKDAALKIINQAQDRGMIKPAEDRPANQLPPRGQPITPIQINNSDVTIGPNSQ
jgi:hypothetical protein